MPSACSSAIRAAVEAPDRSGELLGVVDAALFVRLLGAGDDRCSTRIGVIGVVAADAVRLPCALALASTSSELPLTALRPSAGHPLTIGSGRVRWVSAAGPVTVTIAREWAPPRIGAVLVLPDRLAALQAALGELRIGVEERAMAGLSRAAAGKLSPDDAVAGLLGNGPGLTPSGDDLLAGFVLAARAFGLAIRAVRTAIAESAGPRTTALSAQLLQHALRGECIPELAEVIRAMGGPQPLEPVLERLLRVGHTSGAALAGGVAIVATAISGRAIRGIPKTTGGWK